MIYTIFLSDRWQIPRATFSIFRINVANVLRLFAYTFLNHWELFILCGDHEFCQPTRLPHTGKDNTSRRPAKRNYVNTPSCRARARARQTDLSSRALILSNRVERSNNRRIRANFNSRGADSLRQTHCFMTRTALYILLQFRQFLFHILL